MALYIHLYWSLIFAFSFIYKALLIRGHFLVTSNSFSDLCGKGSFLKYPFQPIKGRMQLTDGLQDTEWFSMFSPYVQLYFV